MRLGEAIGAALEARYPLGPRSMGREPKTPISSPRGLRTRMNRIMDKFGGNRRAAAAAVGVPYSTWGHLLKGRGASAKNHAKIADAWGRLFTAPARALVVKKRGYPSGDVRIKAVVVADPGPREEEPEDNRGGGGGGSRYVNGKGSGVTRAEAEAMSGDEASPGYREFRAEGLDVAAIVDAWAAGGDSAAADALLDEVEATYGQEFGFEGDHVEVRFE